MVALTAAGCALPFGLPGAQGPGPGEVAPSPAEDTRVMLSDTGFGGVDIGDDYSQLTSIYPDFPAEPDLDPGADPAVVTYRDVDYTIDPEGIVTRIRPHDPHTSDGLMVGDTLDEAISLYGDPIPGPVSGSQVFAANNKAGTGWLITSEGAQITDIVLCDCIHGGNPETPGTTVSGDTTIVTSRPYLADGSLDPDFGVADTDSRYYGCMPNRGDLLCGTASSGYTIYFCSISDDQRLTCPTGESGNSFVVSENMTMYTGAEKQSLPKLGPSPYRVTLEDGEVCTFSPSSVQGFSDHVYFCSDGEMLHFHPGYEPAFDISGGTWTAQKAGGNGWDMTTVSITLAEIYLVD